MPLRAQVDEGRRSVESGQVSAKFVEHLRWALSFQNRLVCARAGLRVRIGEATQLEVPEVTRADCQAQAVVSARVTQGTSTKLPTLREQ